MRMWHKWRWRDPLWLFLGILTLVVKQRLDIKLWKNEGYETVDSGVVFTNSFGLLDGVLWISFSLFGALFVLRRLAEKTVLYPLLPGRVSSRTNLVWKELITIYLWTAIYICAGSFVTIWYGSITMETFMVYSYSWFALAFLIIVLRMFEDGVRQGEQAYTIWLFIILISTIEPIGQYFPWMYGRAYFMLENGTFLMNIGILFVITVILNGFYVARMRVTDWV